MARTRLKPHIKNILALGHIAGTKYYTSDECHAGDAPRYKQPRQDAGLGLFGADQLFRGLAGPGDDVAQLLLRHQHPGRVGLVALRRGDDDRVPRRAEPLVDAVELEPGLLAVAAPVLLTDGTAVAAISVSAPSSRLTARQVGRVGSLLVHEARALSALLARSPQGRGGSRKVGAA